MKKQTEDYDLDTDFDTETEKNKETNPGQQLGPDGKPLEKKPFQVVFTALVTLKKEIEATSRQEAISEGEALVKDDEQLKDLLGEVSEQTVLNDDFKHGIHVGLAGDSVANATMHVAGQAHMLAKRAGETSGLTPQAEIKSTMARPHHPATRPASPYEGTGMGPADDGSAEDQDTTAKKK